MVLWFQVPACYSEEGVWPGCPKALFPQGGTKKMCFCILKWRTCIPEKMSLHAAVTEMCSCKEDVSACCSDRDVFLQGRFFCMLQWRDVFMQGRCVHTCYSYRNVFMCAVHSKKMCSCVLYVCSYVQPSLLTMDPTGPHSNDGWVWLKLW